MNKCKYFGTAACPEYDGVITQCPHEQAPDNCFSINKHEDYVFLNNGNYWKEKFIDGKND